MYVLCALCELPLMLLYSCKCYVRMVQLQLGEHGYMSLPLCANADMPYNTLAFFFVFNTTTRFYIYCFPEALCTLINIKNVYIYKRINFQRYTLAHSHNHTWNDTHGAKAIRNFIEKIIYVQRMKKECFADDDDNYNGNNHYEDDVVSK